jgi:tetratricopeptide (TPR) repeat protein
MEIREAMLAAHTRTPPPAPTPVEEQYEAPPEVEEVEPLVVEEAPQQKEAVEVESIDTSLTDDFMLMPPSFGVSEESSNDDHAFPPLPGLAESAFDEEVAEAAAEAVAEAEAEAEEVARQQRVPTPRATLSIGSAEAHLRRRLELEPENWELRRQLGEALLDTGDRDGGLYELELAMVGFELRGDIERAQEVVDEILGVFPASVGHHQKRVEYAVRSRDRVRLTHSYLELADALFRTGAGDKAVAVYSRVLELDKGNERAEFALATLAPDQLVKVLETPERPSRWTNELEAIDGTAPPTPEAVVAATESAPSAVEEPDTTEATVAESAPSVDEPAAIEAAAVEIDVPAIVESPVPDEAVEDVKAEEPSAAPAKYEKADTPVESIELPDPDWGEGHPTPSDDRFAPPPDLQAVVDEFFHVDEPAAAPEPEAVEANADIADGEPVMEPDAPFDSIELDEPPPPRRAPTPARASTPTLSLRLTPRMNPSIDQAREAARRLTPAVASDSDFVDLGDWLRHTEPTRSTRMQVEDPKPTGDEQADFEEMLRRFKRGVADNVEAEDYEAHYDLGVAFKEMGLVDEAIAQFQKSLRGATHRVRSYEALGQCFVEQEKYPIAGALLQRATELPGTDDQQLVGVLYLLGFALEHQGRPADALPYYLRVFAVDIEFRDISARVAALGTPPSDSSGPVSTGRSGSTRGHSGTGKGGSRSRR